MELEFWGVGVLQVHGKIILRNLSSKWMELSSKWMASPEPSSPEPSDPEPSAPEPKVYVRHTTHTVYVRHTCVEDLEG